ncbi:LysM peptidoglycan-binding domain-containing protein [Micromonospora sp. 15K316]|uniref:LysM peptidoglycan-binding domain-containing protein n=1 Tax=Micromonospora sp. 15K316 TaxID=2530376 RepID=UPI001051D30F|nr:LysM peptidoglycan-binding domain-containing protein [Micromonospora sp. 15K316]TDC31467.1 LysM peptidoglycan-binding domain-containing protein [Micromonospora sp. 15K316]
MSRSAVRRTGRVVTGFGALVLLCAVLVGAPVALLALAGNPLPDHVPTLAEVGTALTSRDDGQLFLRALALVGWFGWATFTLSVLVELGAQALRRPAPRLPGMSRQQRAAAALVGSVALIVAAAPAASAATIAGQAYAGPAASTPAVVSQAYAGPISPVVREPVTAAASTEVTETRAGDRPVYRVAKGDYLGAVAERYLDEFADYRELARINRLADPDRIRPGQLLKLPQQATDRGVRPHATGRLVDRPSPRPAPERVAGAHGARPAPAASGTEEGSGTSARSEGKAPPMTVGAARAGEADRLNRPLAVSAVLAVASIVGAQIGAVLGLRRRPVATGARADGGSGATRAAAGGQVRALPSGQAGAHARAAGELPVGRHRRD